MHETILPLSALGRIPLPDEGTVCNALAQARTGFQKKIVVLDDDPTGIQTVHDVPVYTDWQTETLIRGLQEEGPLFFVLTNSRSFTAKETEAAHRQIARNLAEASRQTGMEFLLVSRGDSTLRGHYPLETAVLREELEQQLPLRFDGEILMPYFSEGGRYTIDNIHYVRMGDQLVPVGQTEFARDTSFSYHASDLTQWCEERTAGRYPAKSVCCISLAELRRVDIEGICRKLTQVSDFGKVVVNAADDLDVAVFTAALLRVIAGGKNYLFRCAAGLVRVLGGISSRPLLTRVEMGVRAGGAGLVMVGSHVKKTTEQLQYLLESNLSLHEICFDAATIFDDAAFRRECDRVVTQIEANLQAGQTAVVYTSRTVLHAKNNDSQGNLTLSVRISGAMTSLVRRLSVRPDYLIAKGGITSSDIGVKGLGVRRAWVVGQIQPGIPVWQTDRESRFPGMPYVIFPGNVGNRDTLYRVTAVLQQL